MISLLSKESKVKLRVNVNNKDIIYECTWDIANWLITQKILQINASFVKQQTLASVMSPIIRMIRTCVHKL